MGWRVEYLEGTECPVCKELKKNVIEPSIKVISPDGKEYPYKECIFHCDKGGEPWIFQSGERKIINRELSEEVNRR